MGRWAVEYAYDGGRGSEVVAANTREEAIEIGMAAARPTWASDKSARCTLTSAYRLLSYDEVCQLPHGGLERAVDISWDRRDTGRAYLVVERGSRQVDGRSHWTTSGRIVATTATEDKASALSKGLRRRNATALYTVAPRSDVVLSESGAAYGCLAGEATA